jgi:hypothetical protein
MISASGAENFKNHEALQLIRDYLWLRPAWLAPGLLQIGL